MKKQAFQNGIVKYMGHIKRDFLETQRILDIGCTSIIEAEKAYSERAKNDFEGTYQIAVEPKKEYEDFLMKLYGVKNHVHEFNQFRDKMLALYFRGLFSSENELIKLLKKGKAEILKNDCTCKKCSFRNPSFEEWQDNFYQDEKNSLKLSKKLSRLFPREIVDFYMIQNRANEEIYLTITAEPQYIAGMAFYNNGQWNSCQNPKRPDNLPLALGGSLYDDKLFIAFLHNSLNDLENMDGKMIARTALRMIEIDGKNALISTKNYGTDRKCHLLEKAIEEMAFMDVYSYEEVSGKDIFDEPTNGYLEVSGKSSKNIEIELERKYLFSCKCSTCAGAGEIEKNELDTKKDGFMELEFKCPMCTDGTYSHAHTDGETYDIECPLCEGEMYLDESILITDVFEGLEERFNISLSDIDMMDDMELLPCPTCAESGTLKQVIEVSQQVILREGIKEDSILLLEPYAELYGHYGDFMSIGLDYRIIKEKRVKHGIQPAVAVEHESNGIVSLMLNSAYKGVQVDMTCSDGELEYNDMIDRLIEQEENKLNRVLTVDEVMALIDRMDGVEEEGMKKGSRIEERFMKIDLEW